MKMVFPSANKINWSNDWKICDDGWWIDVIIVLPWMANSRRTSIKDTADVLSKPDVGSISNEIKWNHS